MKINIYPLTSSLHNETNLNNDTKLFLESLEEIDHNEYKVVSLDRLYEADLSLILIRSGGSEELFLNNIKSFKKPIYLLTYGFNNSLAASIEILSYLNMNNITAEILHGSPTYITSRIKELIKEKK